MAAHTHTFPGSHVLQLVQLVARWDIASQALLSGTGLTEAELERPDKRIPGPLLRDLLEQARALTGEPGIGFYLGLARRYTHYGMLGFASQHAGTLRESLMLTVRYTPTVTTAISFDLTEVDQHALLTVHEHFDMGSAHDIGTFSLIVGMRRLTEVGTGKTSKRAVTRLPFPKPAYFDRFAHLLPNAEFNHPQLQLVFQASGLDVPLVAPDRAAMRLAQAACEAQMQALGFRQSWSMRAARAALTEERVLSIEEVARSLGTSTRTLKRRLQAEGATFSSSVESRRRELAEHYLALPELSLEDIAERLHYSSVPNFARAFRRWTGRSPAQHRAHLAR